MGRIMTREPRLFDIDARLRELSAKGDDLERVTALRSPQNSVAVVSSWITPAEKGPAPSVPPAGAARPAISPAGENRSGLH